MIITLRDRPRGLAAAAVLFAVLAATPAAHAASPADRTAAREHLTQAQDLKKQGQLSEALVHFAESQRLDPKLMTLIELAETEEQLGKLVEAQAHWAAARERAGQDSAPKTKQRAEERLAAVEKRISHLTLQPAAGAPADLQVFRDEALLEPASIGTSLATNPGEHSIVVKVPGHDDAKYSVKLAEGESQTLALAVGPPTAQAPAAAPPPKAAPPPPPPKPDAQLSVDSSSSGSGQRAVGLILGSVGLVGLGGGTFLWINGAQNSNRLGPSADRNKLLGQIAVGAGGVLLVTGVVLFVTAPSSEPKSAGLRVLPIVDVGNSAAVVGAAGEF